jgi:hypothetical protein
MVGASVCAEAFGGQGALPFVKMESSSSSKAPWKSLSLEYCGALWSFARCLEVSILVCRVGREVLLPMFRVHREGFELCDWENVSLHAVVILMRWMDSITCAGFH